MELLAEISDLDIRLVRSSLPEKVQIREAEIEIIT